MLKIFLLDKFLVGNLKGLVHKFLKCRIPFNDTSEERQNHFADVMTILLPLGLVKILNHGDDLIKNVRFGFLYVVHKLPKFLLLGTVDDKAIAVF